MWWLKKWRRNWMSGGRGTYTAYFILAFAGGEILLFPIILAVKLSGSNIFSAMAVAFAGTLSRVLRSL